MNRREFLGAVAVAPMAMRGVKAAASRTFEITTKISLEESHEAGIAWVPLPLARRAPYQIDRGYTVSGNADNTRVEKIAGSGAAVLIAEWGHMMPPPEVIVTIKVETSDYRVGLAAPNGARRTADLANYLKPTKLIPVDGIVKQTADAITKGKTTDVAKARALYDWIVENTARNPDVKGCGLGDIRGMLEMKNLSGKCADLNALFVGLARASNLPARDLYGLRVAPSSQFPSLGRAGGNVTTAQHCRAEVWADNYGWIPVDPADVRKLMLEEKKPSLGDPYVGKAREALFGSWEMNWIAFNDAHDVVLPGSKGKPLPFVMYPQAEVGGERLDSLDPEHFKYTITAREM
ncbi:MAG TPA: transglutaminase domain-containing protein [Vicinamibacterales bacterium]|nr:transglutaminase domain-containing protein [Vicinamibacterales bacterium]